MDKDEKEEEKMSREEKILLDFIRDHSDPLTENQNPTLSELLINSPKDTTMSDKNDSNVNEKCQAQASDSQVTKSHTGSNNNSTKSDPGSTTGHHAESIANKLSSKTAKVYDQEEEEVRTGSEIGKEQAKGASGGGRGEVEITGEMTGGRPGRKLLARGVRTLEPVRWPAGTPARRM